MKGNFEAALWRHRWRSYREKYFFYIIGDGLSDLRSNFSCVQYFNFFKKAATFRSRQTFLLDVMPEVEYTSKIAMSISDIFSFWSTLYLKYWRGYINFKISLTLWPGDVINDVMDTRLYKCIHNLLIPMHRKLDDDIFARFFSYHEKCSYLICKGI